MRRTARDVGLFAFLVLLSFAIGVVMAQPSWAPSLRVIAGLSVTAVLAVTTFRSVRLTCMGYVTYSAIVAFLRRLLPADGLDIDGLLIPIPAIPIILAALAVKQGGLKNRSTMTNLVLALFSLAILGTLNPLQGSILVGVVGLAFFGIPMLWFFVGSQLLADDDVLALLKTVIFCSIPIGVYGLIQAAGSFLPSDRAFFEDNENVGSFLDGKLRPLGTMATTGEFARFSMTAAILCVAALWASRAESASLSARSSRTLSGPAQVGLAGVAALLTVSTVLTGVRLSLLTAILGAAVIASARVRVGLVPRWVYGLVVVIASIGMIRLGGRLETGSLILERQVDGLSNPFDANSASISKRVELAVRTARDLVPYPMGRGSGVTTPAADRFADRAITTETDVGDVAASWGIPGLVLYVALIVTGARTAYMRASERTDWVSLGALGVLAVAATAWINGGLYAIAPMVWITLGWTSQTSARPLLDVPDAPDVPASPTFSRSIRSTQRMAEHVES